MKNKKAQIWVETVIYTLIGLVLIGTVLAFATPVIQKQQDKSTIDRTVSAMSEIDNAITNVKNAGISNARVIDFLISEGSFTIDGEDDTIFFQIDESSYAFSEVRTTVDISGTNIRSRTVEQGNKFGVTLSLNYDGKLNITYNGKDKITTLGASPNPYRLIIENGGKPLSVTGCTEDVDCGSNYECTTSGVNMNCKPKYININIYDAS